MKQFINQILFTLFLLTSFSAQAGELMVSDPWVRAGPPNAPALAAFMKLDNHSATALSVVEVRTSLAVDRVELHRTQMKDGVMKMIPQEAIPVGAHSSTLLKPGSWHIMLIKPAEVPNPGDMVKLTLVLDNGSEKTVSAMVRKGMKMMSGDHDHNMKHD
ncbi:MAG: copper chaperone PCu(A)C [Gammaproteobacteria bacterium]|nr:copper chaperone PCu(A)C [Gammaproteobacteria bacterium]